MDSNQEKLLNMTPMSRDEEIEFLEKRLEQEFAELEEVKLFYENMKIDPPSDIFTRSNMTKNRIMKLKLRESYVDVGDSLSFITGIDWTDEQ